MRNSKKAISILPNLLLSTIFVFLSILFPVKVINSSELEFVKFGYPFHYIIQDQSTLTPPSYPVYTKIISPLEHPIDIIFLNFFLSIFVVLFMVQFIKYLFKIFKKLSSG